MGKTAYGEGSIYQRSDGRWAAQLDMGWRNGRRQRKLVYGPTRRDVQGQLRAALKAKQDGTLRVGSQQTTGHFLQRWLEDSVKPSVRPATYSMYWHLTTKHLIPNLDRVPLEKLSPEHVQALLRAKTDEGLAPRTVHHLRALLRIALNRAMRWGLVVRNVAALADSPRIERFDVRMLAPAEAKQLLAAAEDDRLGALYSVALALGLRQGEALGLSWEDIDFESRRLHVRHGLQRIAGELRLVEPKTRQSRRTIAMPGVVIDALQHHRAKQTQERLLAGRRWRDTRLVFTSTIGTPIEVGNLRRSFWKLLDRAGLPRMRFHDLRHSCASLLLVQGVPARVVMETLGHSNISITMDTYTHVLPELQRQASDAMDRALGNRSLER
jgi:integrase